MVVTQLCHRRLLLWICFIILFPVCLLAQEEYHKFYHFELGVQVGTGYYVGELAPHVFTSVGEVYGAQARIKIDPRWALQIKAQRQRIVNNVKEGNDFGITPGRYQLPMWHFDVIGEFNFFQLGLNDYNVRMKSVSPYMFLGVGMTAQNVYASRREEYPRLAKGTNTDFAMYIPLGIGLKWKIADRWQLQLAWQHQVYVLNGDGLEGVITGTKGDKAEDKCLNDSHNINGSNVMNNDVTSTLTAGVVFEFGVRKKKCTYCLL